MRFLRDMKVLLPLLALGVLAAGYLIAARKSHETTLTPTDYVGSTEVSPKDAGLYRVVAFEWRVASRAGLFKGSDQAFIRIDLTGESPLLCGWILADKAGTSVRATRWLSQARLGVGDLKVATQFIAPTEKKPGDGLHAGCARLSIKTPPAPDAALTLEGPPVQEQ